MRPRAVMPARPGIASSLSSSRELMSVSVMPGEMLLTVIPRSPTVLASERPRTLSAPFVIEYAVCVVANQVAPEELFETFRAWQNSDGSVRSAAEALTCHPNTVRHRLRRIEKRTGRALSRPRDGAELRLAFEVHRPLILPKP